MTSIYQNSISYSADNWTDCATSTTVVGVPNVIGTPSVAVVPIELQVFSESGGQSVNAPGGIGGFSRIVEYFGPIDFLNVSFPAGFSGVWNNYPLTSTVTFSANNPSVDDTRQAQFTEAYLHARLTGCTYNTASISLSSSQPNQPYTYGTTDVGANMSAGTPTERFFRRGDASS